MDKVLQIRVAARSLNESLEPRVLATAGGRPGIIGRPITEAGVPIIGEMRRT